MPQKDDKLLQDLVEKYAKKFVTLAANNGATEHYAEDVVMEAFWSYYRSDYYDTLTEEQAVIMLARIVRNRSIDYYRKMKRTEQPVGEEEEDIFDSIKAPSSLEPETVMIESEGYSRIRETIENLKPVWRDTAILYFIEGRSYPEISEALGISEEVCRSRISRARKYLEGELNDLLE